MRPKIKHTLFSYSVRRFISNFPELKYDGCTVCCLVCNKRLLTWTPSDSKHHLRTAAHVRNRKSQIPYAMFLVDFLIMINTCNLPFSMVRQPRFQAFWRKYASKWKLPSNSTIQWYLPRVQEKLENIFRNKLRKKKLWVIVHETRDSRNNSILNVLVRTLAPKEISPPYLLACKRIRQSTVGNIQEVIINTFKKFEVGKDQVLMLVTDYVDTMLQVGQSLKLTFPKLIHTTCILHALHLVTEVARIGYEDVDDLIVSTKEAFSKAKQIKEFRKSCPNVSEPPERVFTRWGVCGNTWLDSVFYYLNHFQQIKDVVLKLNPKVSKSIKDCQQKFKNPQVLEHLQTISNSYSVVLEAMDKFQNSTLTLNEALSLVESITAQLQTLTDNVGIRANEKFNEVLINNVDYNVLRECLKSELLSDSERYLLYANITTSDAEKTYSLYKNIFAPGRKLLHERVVETYAMMKVHSHSNTLDLLNC